MITDWAPTAEGVRIAFDWHAAKGEEAIAGTLTGAEGAGMLDFGPTEAVAHWPAWLRTITRFGETGGEVRILLDPHRMAEPDPRGHPATGLRGSHARSALAALLADLAQAIGALNGHAAFEPLEAVAALCGGMALTLTAEPDGMLPSPADPAALFRPAPVPLLIDDHNTGPGRQHARLTYRLPYVAGRLATACSLRLFHSEQAFGIEFRTLTGDHLPLALQPACIVDGLGFLLRLTVDRGDGSAVLEGNGEEAQARQIACAITRQAVRDIAADPALAALAGFAQPLWRHWLAALPDILASAPSMSLDIAHDHQTAGTRHHEV